jgi:hypothetical protein
MLILSLTSLHSGILECRRVTGDGCFLTKRAVIDPADHEPVPEPFLAPGQMTAARVQSTPVSPRPRRSPAEDPRFSGFF